MGKGTVLEPGAPGGNNGPPTRRRRIFEILDGGSETGAGKACDTFLVILILLNAAALVAESVPRLHETYGWHFHLFEVVSVAIFTFST